MHEAIEAGNSRPPSHHADGVRRHGEYLQRLGRRRQWLPPQANKERAVAGSHPVSASRGLSADNPYRPESEPIFPEIRTFDTSDGESIAPRAGSAGLP